MTVKSRNLMLLSGSLFAGFLVASMGTWSIAGAEEEGKAGAPPAAEVKKDKDATTKVIEFFRWKNNLPADVTAVMTGTKDSTIKGLQSGSLDLARGDQKQSVEVLFTKDGHYAIFTAAQGTIKESVIKGAKEATVTTQGRPLQILIAGDGKTVVLGTIEDISVDIAAEKAKKAAEDLRKAQEAVKKITVKDQPSRGPQDAKVTIIEFSDFQCPFCAKGYATLEEVMKGYGDKVRLIFKNFPLGFHPWAEPSAIASECVYDQDEKAFWTVYDYYFSHQKELTVDNVKDKTLEALKDSKIDAAKFKECFDGKKTLDRVKADQAEGQQVGVNGTPAFFINGRFLNGAVPAEQFKTIIDDELKQAGKN